MLDLNVRADYGRLQRIATISGVDGPERRALLEFILTDEYIESNLVEQFGSRSMQAQEQLVSLFYYMGMLTFGPESAGSAMPHLVIPKLGDRAAPVGISPAFALKDDANVWLDTRALGQALSAMAVNGDISRRSHSSASRSSSGWALKDLRQFSEKVLKLMLLAYISQSRVFHILSEKEFSGGYCDLFLGLSEGCLRRGTRGCSR